MGAFTYLPDIDRLYALNATVHTAKDKNIATGQWKLILNIFDGEILKGVLQMTMSCGLGGDVV